jgi:uncharacterized membrane protein (DUF485 family)
MSERPAPRITVTHPRTVAPRLGSSERPSIDLDEESPVNDVALRSLMRAHLRLSLTHVAALVVLMLAIPLLLANAVELSQRRIFGVPIAWLLLGAGMFPALWLIARSYVRRVEELEVRTRSLLRGS